MRYTFLLALLVMVCKTDACQRSSSSSSSSGGHTYDLGKSDLTRVYNSKVKKVESYERPLAGSRYFKHTGVVATTKNGGRYLIHKGLGYGKDSSTVLVDAKHMSGRWSKTGEESSSGKTISDLMDYGLVDESYGPFSLCWDSTENIMDHAGDRRRKRRRRKRSCRR